MTATTLLARIKTMSSRANQNKKAWLLGLVFLTLTVAIALVRQNRTASVPPPTKPEPSLLMDLDRISLTGWLTIIWNGEPQYLLTDDEGRTTELLINDILIKKLGGPLSLDRTRVTVVGTSLSANQDKIIVLTLKLADDLMEE